MMAKVCLLSCALLLFCSCSGSNRQLAGETRSGSEVGNANVAANERPGEKVAIKLTSTAFPGGGMIPAKYTCDGTNVSPPLEWSDAPQTTKSLALICDDPDAPGKTWVHWVVFDLSAGRRSLPENVPPQDTIAGGGKQGTNDFKKIGYGGPCPPSGTHRYFFKIYALDTELKLDSKATKDLLLQAMKDHILAQGELIGRYKRIDYER
jgi:Raf kinase inhibitor-like YbhB/YbcL family protein